MYKATNKLFDYLYFYDCVVEKNTVIIDFKFVYVSPEDLLNPYGVAKSTDKCRLTFYGGTDSNTIIHLDEGGKKVLITDLEEMKFLQFSQKTLGDFMILKCLVC